MNGDMKEREKDIVKDISRMDQCLINLNDEIKDLEDRLDTITVPYVDLCEEKEKEKEEEKEDLSPLQRDINNWCDFIDIRIEHLKTIKNNLCI